MTRKTKHENLDLKELEKKIGYSYKDTKNLLLALTHSSYANERRSEKLLSNERLEFLGDSILSIVISEEIYVKHTQLSEGDMTRVRANIVCETSLVQCANAIGIGDYLLLGKGEELTGGRDRVSIISDAFEAIIGSIYIDGGMKKARKFILDIMKAIIQDSVSGIISMDYKTQFQEIIQKNNNKAIAYQIVQEKGPDHDKTFVSQVKVGDTVMGIGKGRTKKEAEQNAAKAAIQDKKKC